MEASRHNTTDNGQPDGEGNAPPSPLEPLLRNIQELRAFVEHYVQAQSDLLRMRVRRIALAVVTGLVLGVIGVAALVKAAVLTLEGASGAAAEAWGGRAWAGQLTIGLAVLVLVVLVVGVMGRRVQSVARKKSIARYEERERKQRATFGHTAADYARANNGRSSNG